MRNSTLLLIIMGLGAAPSDLLIGQISIDTGTETQSVGLLLATFQAQQESLQQSLTFLLSENLDPQNLQLWQIQNADLIAAQEKVVLNIESTTTKEPLSYIDNVDVPDNASQDVIAFLTTKADLFNRYVTLYNQSLSPISGPGKNVAATFVEQNSSEIQTITEQVQVISGYLASQPLQVPPVLVIPSGTPLKKQLVITLQDQIERGRIVLWNQNLSSTPAQRAAALQQWVQQNAGPIQQLQQAIQSLSQTTAN